MWQDIRHAVRLMGRQKAFTAAAIMTLALGIGANTAIFSMVYGVLLRPLPYPEPDRLVRLYEEHPGGVSMMRSPALSNLTYYAWRDTTRTLDGLAAYASQEYTLTGDGNPARVSAASVSPVLFRLLDARPRLGRVLHDEDALRGAPGVVVLANGFWSERYGSMESAVGRTLTLDGQPYTIVGVMPPGFYFPDRRAQFWVPHRVLRAEENPSRPFGGFWAVGRLRPGVTFEQAAAEGTAAARSTGPRPMAADLLLGKGGPVEVRVRPLLEEVTARVRPALFVLLASAGLVLIIACANVANLLLSRGVVRRREFAVRSAIGAGRRRLIRQLLTEAAVLAALGGAGGVALAWTLTHAVPILAPENFPRLAEIRVDGAALAFAAASALAAALVSGVLPILRVGDTLLSALRDGTGASASAHTRRLGAGLLIAEAAVAVVLLVSAGLLGRSFVRLLQVDPGYDVANVLMARVYPQRQQGSRDRDSRFAQALVDRTRAMPGVIAAGAGNMAPLVLVTAVVQLTLTGDSREPITARALSYVVTPGYGEALGLRVREGRLFEQRDMAAPIRPLIINEEFARVHFNDDKPVVGRRFTASFSSGVPVEIVGVVANVLKDGLDAKPQIEMYNLPRDAFGFGFMNVAIRTSGNPLALVGPLRQAVRDLDPSAAIDGVETLGSRVSASVSEPRFAMSVLASFAVVALVLAAVGLYGVLSYQVAQRRRELGVRAALGADRGSLVGLIMRQALGVTLAGIVLGLGGAVWASRLLQGLLFGITPHDAVVFGVAPITLLMVAIAATVIPARRAAAADPIEVLRSE